MKKFVRFAGVALLALAIGGGCGDDDDPVAPPAPPPPIVGTVSGTVSVEGSGLAGVSVSAASQSATTGSSGGYSFANVPAGTHSVQISGAPADVTFTSTAKPVTIATSGQMATADFSGTYIRTSIITGSVTAGGEGVVATVTATGTGMLTDEEPKIGGSNADGDFELTGLRAGGYMVTISDYPEGTEFLVIARNVTVGVGLTGTVSFNTLGEDGPTTGTGVFLIITDVTDDDGDPDKTSGRVTAMLDIERGDARFEKITLYVDGVEVDSRLFGGVARAPAQVGVGFDLSFDSKEYEYDQATTEATVTYENGPHRIVAGVTVVGSEVEEYSQQWDVELENDDGVHALAIFQGGPVVNPSTGEGWYGGPDAGITVAGILVSYSGDMVGSLTLLDVCGNKPITDSEAPFVFGQDELKCDETRVLTEEDYIFRIAEREVGILNHEGVFPLRLDFEGPGAPRFQPNPNGRQLGWINDMVELTGKYDEKTNKDGWLVYGSAGVGVGGNAAQLRYSTTTPSIVNGAIAAEASSTLPEATRKDAICFVVTAMDLLGNESALPDDDADCFNTAVYGAAVVALEAAEEADDDDAIAEAQGNIPAGIRAGVDVTDPTIEFSTASPKENGSSLKNFQVQVEDVGGSTGKSGLHSDPVLAKVEARNAANKVLCGDHKDVGVTAGGGKKSLAGECQLAGGFGDNFNDPLATTAGLSSASETGYYTFTALTRDKAGNESEQIVRTAVNDGEGPKLGLIVGGYAKDVFSLTATLTDDLSIKQYWAEAFDELTLDNGAVSLLILPSEGAVAVDDYNNMPNLKQSHLTDPPLTMEVFRALQAGGPATAPTSIDSIRVVATDHGGNHGSAFSDQSATATTTLARFGRIATPASNLTPGDFDDEDLIYSRDEVFQTFMVTDDDEDADVLELRAEIVGTAGYTVAKAAVLGDNPATPDAVETTFVVTAAVIGVEGLVNNPVSRVDFYVAVDLKDTPGDNRVPPAVDGAGTEALKFIGSASAAGAEDFMADPNSTPDDAGDDVASRKYVWGIDMSGADLLEAVDGNDAEMYTFVAFAVNSDGVAIPASVAEMVDK